MVKVKRIWIKYLMLLRILRGPVSKVTCYGLDGPGIFCPRPDRAGGSPSLPYDGYRFFHGRKAAGAWRLPPTPSSAEVKERVELCLYSPSGPSWPVLGEIYFIEYSSCTCYSLYFNKEINRVIWNSQFIPLFCVSILHGHLRRA